MSASQLRRLEQFFAHYAPEKIEQAKMMLKKFEGKEPQLFLALEKRYGLESAVPGAQDSNNYRNRLVAFYTMYNPEKLESVDDHLARFAGKEDEMFEKLIRKYGPEPGSSSASSPSSSSETVEISENACVVRTCTSARAKGNSLYCPAHYKRLDSKQNIVENLAIFEGRCANKNCPHVGNDSKECLGFCNPTCRNSGKDCNKSTCKMFSEDDDVQEAEDSSSSSSDPSSDRSIDRARLVAIWTKYQPDKLDIVDVALERYAGREDLLFGMLKQKFGYDVEPYFVQTPYSSSSATSVAAATTKPGASFVDPIAPFSSSKVTDRFFLLYDSSKVHPGVQVKSAKLVSVDISDQGSGNKKCYLVARCPAQAGADPQDEDCTLWGPEKGGWCVLKKEKSPLRKARFEEISIPLDCLNSPNGLQIGISVGGGGGHRATLAKGASIHLLDTNAPSASPSSSAAASATAIDPFGSVPPPSQIVASVNCVIKKEGAKEFGQFEGYIEAIIFKYRDGSSKTIGTNSGALQSPFDLEKGEYIVEIGGRKGNSQLDLVYFKTNTDRAKRYGYARGGAHFDPFTAKKPDEAIIFVNRGSNALSAITSVITGPAPETETPSSSVAGGGGGALAAVERKRQRKDRLGKFYSYYQVPRTDQELEKVLLRYDDDTRLYNTLTCKYGPEPPEDYVPVPVPPPTFSSSATAAASGGGTTTRAPAAVPKKRMYQVSGVTFFGVTYSIFEPPACLEFSYTDGTSAPFGNKPRKIGNREFFSLRDGEHLVQLSGRIDRLSGTILALRIHTSTGRNTRLWGDEEAGSPFRSVEVQKGQAIVGLELIPTAGTGRLKLKRVIVAPIGQRSQVQDGMPTALVVARLRAFYLKYAPDRLDSVTKIAQSYKGREELMFKQLVSKYGPEPSAEDSVIDPATQAKREKNRQRLVRFFEKYDPSRIGQVDNLLKTNGDGTDDNMFNTLMARLKAEYPGSTEPGDLENPRDRLVAFYTKYAPEKLNEVDKILAKFAPNNYAKMFAMLEAKYCGGRSGENNVKFNTFGSGYSFRERVQACLKTHAPDSLHMLDKIVAEYAGQEATGIKVLEVQYGPEDGWDFPPRTTSFAPPAILPPPSSTSETTTPSSRKSKSKLPSAKLERSRARLEAYYNYYDPSQIPRIDEILARYNNNITELMMLLYRKYGPEKPVIEALKNNNNNNSSATSAASASSSSSAFGGVTPLGSTGLVPASTLLPQGNVRYLAPSPIRNPALEARLQLTKIFKSNDRPRIGEIDSLLQQNGHRLNEFIRETAHYYGASTTFSTGDHPLVAFDPRPAVAMHGEVVLVDGGGGLVHAFLRGRGGSLLHSWSGVGEDDLFTSWRVIHGTGASSSSSAASVSYFETPASVDTRPAAVSTHQTAGCGGTMEVVFASSDGALFHMNIGGDFAHDMRVSNPVQISPMAGCIMSGDKVSLVSAHPHTCDLFFKGKDSRLYWNRYNSKRRFDHEENNGWIYTEHIALDGTTLLGPPIAVSTGDGAVDVFARGAGDRLVTIRMHTSPLFEQAEELGRECFGAWVTVGENQKLGCQPCPVAVDPETIHVFARCADSGNLVASTFSQQNASPETGDGGFSPFRTIAGECFGFLSATFRKSMIQITSRDENNNAQIVMIDPRTLVDESSKNNVGDCVWVPVAEHQERIRTHCCPTVLEQEGRTVVAVTQAGSGVPVVNVFKDEREVWLGWTELIGGTGDMRRIREAFEKFDTDRSGELDTQEAMAALIMFLPDASVEELLERIKAADTDHNGNLSLSEFAEIARSFV